jgi:hypothetical protein
MANLRNRPNQRCLIRSYITSVSPPELNLVFFFLHMTMLSTDGNWWHNISLVYITDPLTACGAGDRDRLSFNSRRVVLRRDHVSGGLQKSYDNEIRESRPTHSSSPLLAPCMFSMLCYLQDVQQCRVTFSSFQCTKNVRFNSSVDSTYCSTIGETNDWKSNLEKRRCILGWNGVGDGDV